MFSRLKKDIEILRIFVKGLGAGPKPKQGQKKW